MARCYVLSLGLLLLATFVKGQDLYNLSSVREVRLTFAEPNWETILDSLKQEGNDDRLIGTVSIDGVRYDSVGVRYKGNSSYFNVRNAKSSKLPFNIKSSEVRKKQRFKGGYKTLKLSNIFRDPSFLREVLSYEVVGKYMPAPRANFIRLYVNDQLYGLYNSTESVDEDFLKDHFGYGNGTLVKCDPNWNARQIKGCTAGDKASLQYLGSDSICYKDLYEMKSKHGWKDLIALCKVLNESPDQIEDILNVDQTLWMHAFNNVLANLDSYSGRLCHNYYLYRDSFGLFQPIVWDMNLSLGGFRFDGSSPRAFTNEELQTLSPFIHYKSPNRPLISQLLENRFYRKIYLAHVKTILEDHFSNGHFRNRALSIQQQIDFYVKNDTNKLYSYEAFRKNMRETAQAGKSKIVGLLELMDARTSYLQKHPLLKKTAPLISSVQHLRSSEEIAVSARINDGEAAFLFYRYKPHAPFQKIKMIDDGAHGDQSAGDSVYGAKVKNGPKLQYYIVAENEKIATLSPKRASFEFHEVK